MFLFSSWFMFMSSRLKQIRHTKIKLIIMRSKKSKREREINEHKYYEIYHKVIHISTTQYFLNGPIYSSVLLACE